MATTHQFTTNITNGNDTDTQNVNSADDILVNITCRDNISIITRTNCTAQLVQIEQTESGSITAKLKVRFINNGSYTCTVHSSQVTNSSGATANRVYSITGNTSGGTNKEFGLEFFDTSGNLRLGLNTRIPRIFSVHSGTATDNYFDTAAQQNFDIVSVHSSVWTGGKSNWEVIEISDSCNWYIDESYGNETTQAGKVKLRQNIQQNTGSGTNALIENNSYILLVLRY